MQYAISGLAIGVLVYAAFYVPLLVAIVSIFLLAKIALRRE